ncbi:MAG: hypothetical protein GWP20_00585 [Thermotogales bacterium]|nr:hypothetical protein [Thermotogales bacterium]
MKITKQFTSLAYGLGLAMFAGGATAHGLDAVGQPACLEANFMMADAMNAPFAGPVTGPGQVLEVSIVTGARGITVGNPFTPGNAGGPICPEGVACPGPFKPTGVLSGGLNGHAFITSAAQHSLTQFHRDGTPIRTVSYIGITNGPGETGFGQLPRPLGTQMMPNGNLVQAICDANFFNASNSDTNPDGSNRSNNFFPPVYSTPERAANSRILVIDQQTMQVIDEYSQPKDKDPRWTCAAGIAFSEEGMGLSMFHGAAIAMVDWMDGVDKYSRGVGSNKRSDDDHHSKFELGDKHNRAKVTRWIDLRPGKPADDPSRRDSLRAWGYDEDGTIYVTDRERSRDCLEGEIGPGGCNPTVFRQKVQVVDYGDDFPSRTIGLDPGVNVIAGIRPNRMSAVACDNIGGPTAGGTNPAATSCDVETVLIAASAFNPTINGGGFMKPGGGVGEYSILPADADAQDGTCTGEHGNPAANTGCAQPIAQFLGAANNDLVDPRMLMVIHEAFVQ